MGEKTLRRFLARWGCVALAVLAIGWGFGEVQAQGPSSIEFNGYTYTADNFVFCIDRSCSMGWGGWLQDQQLEIVDALGQLPPTASFATVVYNGLSNSWSPAMEPATAASVSLAQAWVQVHPPLGNACLHEGVAEAVSIAQLASGSTAVILITDGGECLDYGSTLSTISAAVDPAIPIHVAFVSEFAVPEEVTFAQEVASVGGGTFIDLSDPLPPSWIRGDANGDGAIDLADPIRILDVGFGMSASPICESAADSNADGVFQAIPDAIQLLSLLFDPQVQGLAAPFPDCGPILPATDCAVSDCP